MNKLPRTGTVVRRDRRSKRRPNPVVAPSITVPLNPNTKDSRGLTVRQELFANEVATEILENGERGAAARASRTIYKNNGAAHLARQNAAVRAAITEHIMNALKPADITRERIALELFRIATFDPGKMFRADGTMIPIPEMDEDTRRCIQGFDVERRTEGKGDDAEVYYVLKPRMYNKNQAAEILTRFAQLPGDLPGSGSAVVMPTFRVNFVSAGPHDIPDS